MAGIIDTVFKLSFATSLIVASGSVGYYYVVYLPDRDAGIARQEKVEKAKAEMARRLEQQIQRSEQLAAEERRANEQAAIKASYQLCIDRAYEIYSSGWDSACKRLADNDAKERAACVAKGNTFCDSLYKNRDPSPNCTLPQVFSSSLNASHEKNKDRCLQESKSGLQ